MTTIILVVIAMSLLLLAVAGNSIIMIVNSRVAYNIIRSAQSYYTAESGIEDSLLRVKDPSLSYGATMTLSLNSGTALTTINQSGDNLEIISKGDVYNRIRRLQVDLSATTSAEASFNYGAQVGAGGLLMKNNSKIIGNIFSGGNIIGINSPEITGDAWASGASTISGFDDLGIRGNVHVSTIDTCLIDGDAYYQIINNSTVGGTLYPGSDDPPEQSLPITEEQITSWKNEASAGGEINEDYILDSITDTIGTVKINGNLNIKGDAVLTLRGHIWVTGDIILENNAAIQLYPSYGDNSELIVSDGTIIVKNNFIICGSEGFNGAGCNSPTESYLLLLSTKAGNPAITMQNGSQLRAVIYAGNGTLLAQNNAQVVEATAYAMEIQNNAQLIYESGLINMKFTSGPSGGWDIQQWQEVE